VRRVAVLALGAAACGRLGFDPLGAGGGGDARGAGDGGSDAAPTGDGSLTPDGAQAQAITLMSSAISGLVTASSVNQIINANPGDLIVAGVYWNHGTATVAVTDQRGLPWSSQGPVAITSGCAAPGGGTDMQLWYALATAGGTDTITATQSTSTDPLGVIVAVYAGVAQANTVTGGGGRLASGASNAMTGPTLFAAPTDMIVGLFGDSEGNGAITVGSGYMIREDDTVAEAVLYDNLPPTGASGLATVTGNLPGGQSDACWVATAMTVQPQ
jgi:hypothetical protein